MRHRKNTFKIGRTSEHRRALLANAACSLFESGSISTTVRKAKEIRRLAERMITLGKKGTLHARRQAIAKLRDPDIVAVLFSEIAPQYQERNGGYTRIMRLGKRTGDAAEICILELVEEALPTAPASEQTEEAEEAGTEEAEQETEEVAAAEESDEEKES